MKPYYLIFIISHSFYSLVVNTETQAQKSDCNFKNQIYQLDFGNSSNEKIFNLASLTNYQKTTDICPEDGYYGYLSSVGDCFGSKWHKILEDHTPGDKEGKMMVVNASFAPGPFFLFKLAGLKPGTVYEWSAWVINICKSADGCIPTPPVLRLTILSGTKEIAKFKTAPLVTKSSPVWLKQSGTFTVPSGIKDITIYMEDITEGGCGNDFALDDFVLKECSIQQVTIPKAMTPKSSGKSKPQTEKPTNVKPNTVKKSDIKSPDTLNNLTSKTFFQRGSTKGNPYKFETRPCKKTWHSTRGYFEKSYSKYTG